MDEQCFVCLDKILFRDVLPKIRILRTFFLMKSVNLFKEKELTRRGYHQNVEEQSKKSRQPGTFHVSRFFLFITNSPMSFSLFLFYANASFYCSDDISSSKIVSSNKHREIGFRPDYQDKSLPKPSPRFFVGKERDLGSKWVSSTKQIQFSHRTTKYGSM